MQKISNASVLAKYLNFSVVWSSLTEDNNGFYHFLFLRDCYTV